jgi:Family of unknown function (DUF6152)
MTRRVLALAVFLVCGSQLLSAHHSAVLFDLTKTVTLAGTLAKIDWRNPHVLMSVEVRNEMGGVDTWTIETGAPSWFRTRTAGKSEFEGEIGRPVVLQVVLAKDGSRYAYVYRISFEGGRSVELR